MEKKEGALFERYLVEHCAPTLANLKTANLFRLPEISAYELEHAAAIWNARMEAKGIRILLFMREGRDALVYVCRRSRLEEDFSKDGVKEFLRQCGYIDVSVEGSLKRLADRLSGEEEFPHEIGIFLGYPLEDVIGFVENKGKNCLYTGVWKVYGNEQEAIRLFERYKKCKQIYLRLFGNGRSIGQLTVAA